MHSLTQREIILLYILFCMILVLCGGYFILPAMQKHNQLQMDHDSVKQLLASTQAGIIDYSNVEDSLQEAKAELNAVKDKFYQVQEEEDVDELITSMAIEHGLTPLELRISNMSEETIKPYQSDEEESQTVLSVKTYVVSLSVNGKPEDIQILVDDVRTTKSLKVSSLTYNSVESSKATITFKIYMI